MRRLSFWLGTAALLVPAAANAADQLKYGKAPDWVVPQAIPVATSKSPAAPVAILLIDQQIRFEPGKTVSYAELAMMVQTAEGLAAGNLSLPWNPATDTVTVNKLQIRRGNQIIDVLASGQTFTTMRRETNLDVAMLDGILTANMQPEGLQQGDIIDLATTTEHVDPVLGNHVEGNFGEWGGSPIQLAHLHVDWPLTLPLKVQAKGFAIAQTERQGRHVIDLTQKEVEPVVPPKGAPLRFSISRLGEATDFTSWADVAALMAPLYRKAAAIPAAGPLHDEVEKIRSSTADPKIRAGHALQLVQNHVRYVALLMGQGGYVPADAATTWSRRFGDCKAKTALLLGILHSLGIEAEPILVQSRVGDAIPERLPLLSYFDHVFVRAHVGGKTYYLDGTRNGDTDVDAIDVPDFAWGLPVIPASQLVALVPAPRGAPNQERRVDVDASAGVYAPAGITLTEIFRGDSAIQLNNVYSGLTGPQKDEVLRREGNSYFDGMQVSSSSTQFDNAKRVLTVVIKGTAKLNWNNGWLYVPTSSIGFNPDWVRPAGPFQDAPIAVSHPSYALDVATIKLPPGFAAKQKLDASVHETLAGVEYLRTETIVENALRVESSERSLASEVPYKDALAAAPRLKALNDDGTYVRLIDRYRATDKDIGALADAQPSSASDLVTAGNILVDAAKFDQAIANFTKALGLDPNYVPALADRGLAYVWLKKYDLADKDLKSAAAIEPDNAVVARARGLQAQFRVDCAAAIEAFTRSLKVDPQNGFALGHRAICQNQVGRYSEALEDAERALTVDPDWQDMHVVRLDSFARLGQRDAAVREADLVAKARPQTAAAAWISFGSVFASAGLEDEAVASFDKALAIKREPSTLVARARARAPTDFEGRMADIEAALKIEPLDVDALTAKADFLAEKGDLKAALAVYDNAMKIVHGVSPLSLGRGIVLYRMGRTAEGERELNLWRRGARTATELNQICWRKAVAGILLASALKDCTEALRINPDFDAAIDSLAFVNLRLGKPKEAASLYDRALTISPMAASYMGRAFAYRALGDKEKARADRSEALKEDVRIEARFASYGLKFDQAVSAPATTH